MDIEVMKHALKTSNRKEADIKKVNIFKIYKRKNKKSGNID